VEGLGEVIEVAVWPDRIELLSSGTWLVRRFENLARWPEPGWVWRWLFRRGVRPKFLPVGERDWFHEPSGRFFKFYTDPPLRVCMPADEVEEHEGSYFLRVRRVVESGGFHTFDLG
jgi:hypothetical protein